MIIPFRIERRYGSVEMALEVYEEDGRKVCGIFTLKGKIRLRPHAWLRTVRREVRVIEGIARRAGCEEVRIAGRNWRRVLPDYEPYDGPRNGIRKSLHG